MPLKTDWTTYLHDIRSHEMDIVFANCPEKAFHRSLELGAGDGFISSILAKYTDELICTDLNHNRLIKEDCENIQYKIVDAEQVGDFFDGEKFDFIFSSSMLEHLPNVEQALQEMHKILADDGLCVHFMPNRCWKLTTVLLHIPNKIAKTIDKALAGNLFKRRKGHKLFKPHKKEFGGNNMKTGRRKQFFLTKPFLPGMHGISNNTCAEIIAFGKKTWIKKFESTGFTVLKVKNCGFNSGYGFGFIRLRKLMEFLNIHSAYAYIIFKQNTNCDSIKPSYFTKNQSNKYTTAE